MTHCLNRVVLFKQKKSSHKGFKWRAKARHNPLVSQRSTHLKGTPKSKSASTAHDTVSVSRLTPLPPSPATAAVAKGRSTAIRGGIYVNGAPTAKVGVPQCRDDLRAAVLWHLGRAPPCGISGIETCSAPPPIGTSGVRLTSALPPRLISGMKMVGMGMVLILVVLDYTRFLC
jgi:hypothetical protein